MCVPHPLFYTERVGSPVEPAGELTSGASPSGEFLEAAADTRARAGIPVEVHVEQAAILVLAIIATDKQTRVGRIIALFIV